jgi:hypothetical protein
MKPTFKQIHNLFAGSNFATNDYSHSHNFYNSVLIAIPGLVAAEQALPENQLQTPEDRVEKA